MNSLVKTFWIAAAIVRATFRDRVAAFFVYVLPFAIIFFVGIALGGTQRANVGLLMRSDDGLSRALAASLTSSDALKIKIYRSERTLETAVQRHAVSAGVVIPADYGQRIRAGANTDVAYLTSRAGAVPPTVRAAVGGQVDVQSARVSAARWAADATHTPFDRALATTGDALPAARPVVQAVGGERETPSGFQYTAPANLVLFMFVNVLGTSMAMVTARRAGVTRRSLASPTSPWVLTVGEALGRWGVAVTQGLLVVVVGAVLFGVRWGDPFGVAALLGLLAAVGAGASLLLGSVASTPEQAFAVTPPIGIVLGMLGGCLWPLAIVGHTMATLGHVSPLAWAMDAALNLGAPGGADGRLGTQFAVLAGFAAILLVAAVLRFRRGVLRAA